MFNRPAHRPGDPGQSSRRTTAALVVAGVALFVALDGSAVAAQSLVKARHIASGAVTSTKIKSGAIEMGHMSPAARRALKGAKGATGSTGANGLSGTNGANGLNGSSGSDGFNGLSGTNGAAGGQGSPGSDGTDGTDGSDGTDGIDGTDGTNGSQGIPGPGGTNGTDGTDGINGTDGVVAPLAASGGSVLLPTATPPTTVVERSLPAGKYVVLGKTQITHSGAGDSIHCELKTGSQVIDQVDMKTLPALAAVPVSMQAVTTTTTTEQLSITCDVSVANGSANFSSVIAVPAN